MDLGLSGLASGFDWRSLVDQLVEVERTPQTRLRSEQQAINTRNTAFGSLLGELGKLRSAVEKLKTGNFFLTRTASSSAEGIAKATASASAAPGQYALNVTQLASAAALRGGLNVGAAIDPAAAVGTAAFSRSISEGTFTTLDDIFNKISTATSGEVTGSYAAGRITLTSGSPIVLGSARDTSNFLNAVGLRNASTLGNTVTSEFELGGVKTSALLADANLTTPILAGAGKFTVNGVEIEYDTAVDSVSAVLDKINNSAAGVSASYDPINDRFQLINKVTGDVGISISDVTGNFAAATGLSTGTLERGTDLVYSVNAGGELRSQTNTISEANSGIPGLTVNVLAEGEATISVASDVELIKKGIKDLVEAYNKLQSLIDTQTASSTDANGKVSAGVLADDNDADEIASSLRRLAYGRIEGLTGGITSLDSLGITTSGDNNLLTIPDEKKLDEALAQNLAGVQALFTDAEQGLIKKLDDYYEKTIGEDGTLVAKQGSLTKQASAIDTQIADLERVVQANRERMIQSFLVMEETQSRVNQQLAFLQQRFASTS
jgi:flagellar hook-associated protein 2